MHNQTIKSDALRAVVDRVQGVEYPRCRQAGKVEACLSGEDELHVSGDTLTPFHIWTNVDEAATMK